MGLDMYLDARKFISKTNFGLGEGVNNPEYNYILEKSPKGLTDNDGYGYAKVTLNVGYWRKANAIHNWFVNECGGSVDNCQEIYVSMPELNLLRDSCKKVLDAPPEERSDVAGEVDLVPIEGFFFGTTEMDEWYIADLEHTVKIIDNLDSVDYSGWDFSYQASW
mgnify:FL=1